MKTRPITATLAAVLACATVWAAQPGEPREDAVDLKGFTALQQVVRGVDGEDVSATRRARAVWPISNGRVFAYAGYGPEASRLFMITGPKYQTRRNHEPHGAFGQSWLELFVDGAPAGSVEREWREVVRAAAVRTRETFEGGWRIDTLDFAHATEPVLVRRVTVTPGAGTAFVRVRVDGEPDGPAARVGATLVKTYRSVPPRTMRVVVLDREVADAAPENAPPGGMLTLALGRGVPVTFTLAYVTAESADAEQRALAAIRAHPVEALQGEALAGWRTRLRDTVTATPDGPIRRHLEAAKKIVLAQRSLPYGGVSPMVSFKGIWARDSNGPVKAFLWMGRPALARDLLVYYRLASALRGATQREYPLDLPVDRAPALDADAWGRTATDCCEVPSWIVLQHAWYYDVSGDASLLRDAWPYLERNAFHQEVVEGPHGPLQRFNGDETYFHGAFYSLFPQRDVWPNQFPRASAYSFDSSFVREQALRALARMAPAAGAPPATAARAAAMAADTRRSVDAHYWMEDDGAWAPALSPLDFTPHRAPFAPVGIRPLWLDPASSSSPRERRHLDSLIAQLGRDNGLCRSTPSVDRFIGSLPGEWLAALAAADHPLAWRALPAVLAAASPSGEFVELHEPDGPGYSYDATWPNRLRPWETGLAMDGVLRFLTGATFEGGDRVTFRPRRPEGLALERLGPIAVGATRLELRYPASDDPRGDAAPVVVVHVAGPPCTVNGTVLGPDASRDLPLVRPRQVTIPAARAFDSRLSLRGGTRLVVTARAPAPALDGDVVLDAGLPFMPRDLAEVLFDAEGRRRYDVLVLAPSAMLADRETMKPARFWTDPALVVALERFEREGGRVERPAQLLR